MTTWYISPSGSDTANTGKSASSPFQTIGKATYNAQFQAGDTVYLRGGTYTAGFGYLQNLQGNANAITTFAAYPGEKPIVSAASGIQMVGCAWVLISGISFQGQSGQTTLQYAQTNQANKNDPKLSANGIYIYSSNTYYAHHITIQNCIVQNFPGGGIAVSDADYVWIDNNIVSGCAWYSPYGNQGLTCLRSFNYDSHTSIDYGIKITNNIVYNCKSLIPWYVVGQITEGHGIEFDSLDVLGAGKTGATNYSGRALIENNLVYNCGSSGICVYKSSNATVQNNTCYQNCTVLGNSGELAVTYSNNVTANRNIMIPLQTSYQANDNRYGTNVKFNQNIYWNTTVAFVAADTTANAVGLVNTKADPLFTNPAAADFSFQAGSPALVTVSHQVTTTTTSAGSSNIFEGNSGTTNYNFSVLRLGNATTTNAATYTVSATGANPVNATDFVGGVLPTGTITFAPGDTAKVLAIPVQGDTTPEPDETFTVTLSNPTNGAIINPLVSQGIILNDDSPTLTLAAINNYQPEGTGGTGTPYTFSVTRTGITTGTTTVQYQVLTVNYASTVLASDFVGGALPTGTITFNPGDLTKTLTILVNPDSIAEPDETFTVQLFNPVPANTTFNTQQVNAYILNDDQNFTIAATDANKAEGNSGTTNFTFTITRTGLVGAAASVNYAVTGGATNPALPGDFVGGIYPAGTLSFAANQTSQVITIPVQGDTVYEPDKSFIVTLSSPTSGATITTATANGYILNDDAAPANATIAIAATDASKAEGNSGSTSFFLP
ncbi:MAG: Calx-beta domain-containing protein [Nostoc sp.]|uniref:Calx-beta domain-containing protein n=1 Tax=Nostoc sp. TaxID=1180 RepID=UPI002FF20021